MTKITTWSELLDVEGMCDHLDEMDWSWSIEGLHGCIGADEFITYLHQHFDVYQEMQRYDTTDKLSPDVLYFWRDQWRLSNGTWRPVYTLKGLEDLADLVDPRYALHVSTEDPKCVSYTPWSIDVAKCNRDIQIRTKLGKFLQKFYSHKLDSTTINRYGNLYSNRPDEDDNSRHVVEIYHNPKEIAKQYADLFNTGVHSCMTKVAKTWRLKEDNTYIHPCEFYGHSENDVIGLALIKEYGKIIGRTVVNSDTKTYVRIYGNEYICEQVLEKAGYKYGPEQFCRDKDGNFVKMAMRVWSRSKNRIILPYLDNNVRVGLDPELFGNNDPYPLFLHLHLVPCHPPSFSSCQRCPDNDVSTMS